MTSRRKAVYVEGLGHGAQPIPNAARIGNLIWSGGVSGVTDGKFPDDVVAQTQAMFANVRATVEAAGASTDDIIRITIFARDRAEIGEALNAAWVEMFPEAHNRPARYIQVCAIQPAMKIQCEFIAVAPD